jgi:enoyl-CoA hydratase/carnithine racemase
MEFIKTLARAPIFEISLNRPDKRNAIRVQMLQEIAQAVQQAEQTPAIRVILVRGEGGCFSAGLDLLGMGGMPELLGENWMQQGYQATRLWQSNLQRLQESFLPSIALLHSYTLGAGLELALACDLRIAAEDVIISLEEARIGLIPDAGGTTRLTQLIGAPRAKELIFTGRRIRAAAAEQWGLVNQVVPPDQLLAAGEALAQEICACAPLAVGAAKRVINGLTHPAPGLHLEMIEQNPLFHSQDLAEGVQSRLEKRDPRWQGH